MKNKRVVALDYIKVVMMILIVIGHIRYTPEQKLSYHWGLHIDLAVPIFMIVSGFVYSASISKLNTMVDYYKPKKLFSKLIRFILPFFVIISIEYLFVEPFNFVGYISFLLQGGGGPGSYYTLVMLQVVVLFPIIYFVSNNFSFKKSPFVVVDNFTKINKSTYLLLSIDIFYNLLATCCKMPVMIYRSLSFRYIGFLTIGIAIYKLYKNANSYKFFLSFSHAKNKNVKLENHCITFTLLLLSILFSLATAFNYYTPTIFTMWISTSMPVLGTSLMIFLVLFYAFKNGVHKKLDKVVNLFGQSTFHIYLMQMVFFYLNIDSYIPIVRQPIVNTIICFVFGFVAYYLEDFFIKKLTHKVT